MKQVVSEGNIAKNAVLDMVSTCKNDKTGVLVPRKPTPFVQDHSHQTWGGSYRCGRTIKNTLVFGVCRWVLWGFLSFLHTQIQIETKQLLLRIDGKDPSSKPRRQPHQINRASSSFRKRELQRELKEKTCRNLSLRQQRSDLKSFHFPNFRASCRRFPFS